MEIIHRESKTKKLHERIIEALSKDFKRPEKKITKRGKNFESHSFAFNGGTHPAIAPPSLRTGFVVPLFPGVHCGEFTSGYLAVSLWASQRTV